VQVEWHGAWEVQWFPDGLRKLPQRRERCAELHRLVEELLNFGRMETGAMRYRLDPLDAAEVVRSVAADFERQLDEGRVELSMPETPCPVRGDRDALSLAVWNLLDNAFKYSPECHTVRVEVARNGTRVAIAVRDQGVGIPRRERKKIFHKFERGAGAIASGRKGTGVGLASPGVVSARASSAGLVFGGNDAAGSSPVLAEVGGPWNKTASWKPSVPAQLQRGQLLLHGSDQQISGLFAPLLDALAKPSRIRCDQIGKADIRRFRAKGRIGRLPPSALRKVETILKRLLEL
jgi:hypothetical protein